LVAAANDLSKMRKDDPPSAWADGFDRFGGALKAPFAEAGLESRAVELRALSTEASAGFRSLDASLKEATDSASQIKAIDMDTPNAGFQKACAAPNAECTNVKTILTSMYAGRDASKLRESTNDAVTKLGKLKGLKTAGLQKAVDGYVKGFTGIAQMLVQADAAQAKADDAQVKLNTTMQKLSTSAKKVDEICPSP
jgi:hypothetical protein